MFRKLCCAILGTLCIVGASSAHAKSVVGPKFHTVWAKMAKKKVDGQWKDDLIVSVTIADTGRVSNITPTGKGISVDTTSGFHFYAPAPIPGLRSGTPILAIHTSRQQSSEWQVCFRDDLTKNCPRVGFVDYPIMIHLE